MPFLIISEYFRNTSNIYFIAILYLCKKYYLISNYNLVPKAQYYKQKIN